jgi:N-acetyl-anhydromuramyl-L-alanine amidase AmpD
MIVLPKLHWIASQNFSMRLTPVDLVVVHDTEGGYTGAISWFSQNKSQVSAHFVLREDGAECTQMVRLDKKAWHAKAFNSRSIGIELAGFASKGFAPAEWQSAANIVAWLLKEYSLPAQWAHHGVGPGFTSHYDLGAAGGGHHDPTTDSAKWQKFVDMVKAVPRDQLPATWPFVEVSRPALDHSNLSED